MIIANKFFTDNFIVNFTDNLTQTKMAPEELSRGMYK